MEKTTNTHKPSQEVNSSIDVSVQVDNFDHASLYQNLAALKPTPGAVVTFAGLVRDLSSVGDVSEIFLEHYPGMTENSLIAIAKQAQQRWPIDKIIIVHRVGRIASDEQIVFVGTASKHRKEAFLACEFIMDYLKNDAPFWKKELTNDGSFWVEAKDSDSQAKQRWENKN